MTLAIRILAPSDADAFYRLRRRALEEAPLAFCSAPEDDRITSEEAAREVLSEAPDSAVLGAVTGELAGMLGLYRETRAKAAHKAACWGLYVAPAWRSQGLGRRLLDAAIRHARSLDGVASLHLSVTEGAVEARRLYERLGFTVIGFEPDSLRHGGRSVGEWRMMLALDHTR